jgi:hypothetical protein
MQDGEEPLTIATGPQREACVTDADSDVAAEEESPKEQSAPMDDACTDDGVDEVGPCMIRARQKGALSVSMR